MPKTQLIFIDGIPGSGKSTTAQWLAETLQQGGLPAQCSLETDDPHPLHSFWSWDDGYCEHIEAPFDADRYTQRILTKCADLVAHLLATGPLHVIECYPFQSGVKIHLKMGATRAQIDAYYTCFQQAVAPLNPVLVFLDPLDLDHTLRQVCRERGTQSEEYLVGAAVRSPYGRQHRLEGWEGMLRFYTDYVALTRALVTQWRCRKLVVAPGVERWAAHRHAILRMCRDAA